MARYRKAGIAVDLSITYYSAQVDGREAAAAENGAEEVGRWQTTSSATTEIEIDGRTVVVREIDIKSTNAQRRSFAWYYSSGCTTAGRLKAKICAARDRLLGSPSPGAFVVASTLQAADGQGLAALRDFSAQLRVEQILPRSNLERN